MNNNIGLEQLCRQAVKHVWPVPENNTYSNDIHFFRKAFSEEAERLGLYEIILGTTLDGNISLYQSANQDADVPHILIAAGFHGEEPAGCWGILNFLRRESIDLFDDIAISFLPAINLCGLTSGQRFNEKGENPNRGFTGNTSEIPSQEGKILLRHEKLLKNSSAQGVICCHEDILRERSYVYSFERDCSPGYFSFALSNALNQYFPLVDNENIDGAECQEGIIFNHFDSSFESWLFSLGADVAACTETPGLQPFAERTEANCYLMGAFIMAILTRHHSET